MKTLIFILLFIIASIYVITIKAQSYNRKGDTFSNATNTCFTKKEVKETEYKWQDNKGKSYPIYIVLESGRCFVKRISENGKEYKYYLNEDICKEICKELNIEYKGKVKRN